MTWAQWIGIGLLVWSGAAVLAVGVLCGARAITTVLNHAADDIR